MVDQYIGETQIGISAGEPQAGDQGIEQDGETLLHIAAPASEALDGSTLNVVETPEGSGIGITTLDPVTHGCLVEELSISSKNETSRFPKE